MFINVMEGYLHYLAVVKNVSPHTIRNYRIDLLNFFDHTGDKDIELRTIDRLLLRKYVTHLSHNNKAKKTIARKISALRSFFRWCLKEHLLEKNPIDELDSPKLDKKLPFCLTQEQIDQFFSQPDTKTILGIRDRAMMELFYSSGIRLSELVQLNTDDIDHTKLTMLIRGKGKKERLVPITQNAMTWITTYLSATAQLHERKALQALFLNRFGTRLTSRSIDRLFQKYVQMSGLVGMITPHTMRHSIATHLLENGMDLKKIQFLLGHSSLQTTTIYTHVSTKLKKKTYNASHPHAKDAREVIPDP